MIDHQRAPASLNDSDFVWRLEAPDGDGPYSSTYRCEVWNGDYYGSKHPSPHEDGLGDPNGMLFGFRDLTQARRWWYHKKDLSAWAGYGFLLVAYRNTDLAKVRRGENQCVFRTGGVKRRAEFPCNWLHQKSKAQLVALADERTGKDHCDG